LVNATAKPEVRTEEQRVLIARVLRISGFGLRVSEFRPYRADEGVSRSALLRLGKQHQDSWSFIRHDLVLLLLRAMGHSQAMAVLVVSWFAVHQEHVMMCSISQNVVEATVPGIQCPISLERDFLPVCERANHFNSRRGLNLAIRQPPPEDFRERLPAITRVLAYRRGIRPRLAN